MKYKRPIEGLGFFFTENFLFILHDVFFICLTLCLQPNMQSKLQKEGAESEQFWDLLGGKSEYPSQKIAREAEGDPHLFSCTLTKGMVSFCY